MMMTATFIAYATPSAGIQGLIISGRNDMFRSGDVMKYGYLLAVFYGFSIMIMLLFVNMY